MSTIRPTAWQAVAAGAATTNGYGSYALDAAGVWTYTLDNSNAAVEALNAGGTLTDTLHRRHRRRHRAGGDHHHHRRQRCGGDQRRPHRATVTEAGGVTNGTPGVPTATGNLNSTDVDNPADGWQAVAAGAATANGYGTYALDAARGVDLHAQQQQCRRCRRSTSATTLTDSFTALTADGTAQVVTITINGSQRCRGDQRRLHRAR